MGDGRRRRGEAPQEGGRGGAVVAAMNAVENAETPEDKEKAQKALLGLVFDQNPRNQGVQRTEVIATIADMKKVISADKDKDGQLSLDEMKATDLSSLRTRPKALMMAAEILKEKDVDVSKAQVRDVAKALADSGVEMNFGERPGGPPPGGGQRPRGGRGGRGE